MIISAFKLIFGLDYPLIHPMKSTNKGGKSVKPQKNIVDSFKKLGITPKDYPHYESPDGFALKFKRCSILESVGVKYASSTDP